MERKIFKKSDKSRIRFDLEFDPQCWWLRSADSDYGYYAGYVIRYGYVDDDIADDCYGILPSCSIWKSANKLVYKL